MADSARSKFKASWLLWKTITSGGDGRVHSPQRWGQRRGAMDSLAVINFAENVLAIIIWGFDSFLLFLLIAAQLSSPPPPDVASYLSLFLQFKFHKDLFLSRLVFPEICFKILSSDNLIHSIVCHCWAFSFWKESTCVNLNRKYSGVNSRK